MTTAAAANSTTYNIINNRKARMEAEQSVVNNPVKMSKMMHQLQAELDAKAEKKRAKKEAKKEAKKAKKEAKKVRPKRCWCSFIVSLGVFGDGVDGDCECSVIVCASTVVLLSVDDVEMHQKGMHFFYI